MKFRTVKNTLTLAAAVTFFALTQSYAMGPDDIHKTVPKNINAANILSGWKSMNASEKDEKLAAKCDSLAQKYIEAAGKEKVFMCLMDMGNEGKISAWLFNELLANEPVHAVSMVFYKLFKNLQTLEDQQKTVNAELDNSYYRGMETLINKIKTGEIQNENLTMKGDTLHVAKGFNIMGNDELMEKIGEYDTVNKLVRRQQMITENEGKLNNELANLKSGLDELLQSGQENKVLRTSRDELLK